MERANIGKIEFVEAECICSTNKLCSSKPVDIECFISRGPEHLQ